MDMQRRKNKNDEVEDNLDRGQDSRPAIKPPKETLTAAKRLNNAPQRNNSQHIRSVTKMKSIIMYESNLERLEDVSMSSPNDANREDTQQKLQPRNTRLGSLAKTQSVLGFLRKKAGDDPAQRRGSGGKKYSFMYEINSFAEESDSSLAILNNSRGGPPKAASRRNSMKSKNQLSWANAASEMNTHKDKRLSFREDENNEEVIDASLVDVPLRLAARELHAACWFDSPVKQVVNLLYEHPEVLNDRTVDPYGCSPLEISIARALCCVCGCCNYNRNKVIAALNKGEDFYREKRNESSENICDVASNISEASINTKLSRRKRIINGDFHGKTATGKVSASLTKAALKQREKEEFQIFSDRESAWIKHAPKFSKLQRVIAELQREIYVISSQLDEKSKQIKNLNSHISDKEENLNFFEKLSTSRYNDKLATHYFKVGMADLDKSKLKASLLENEVNLDKARKDLCFLESVCFDGIDHRLEQMFGRKSLRNCAVLNEICTFACDHDVQQIENLKCRFR